MLPNVAISLDNLVPYETVTKVKRWPSLRFGDKVDGWRELNCSFFNNGTVRVSNGESVMVFQMSVSVKYVLNRTILLGQLYANSTHVLLRGVVTSYGQVNTYFDFQSRDRAVKITIEGFALPTVDVAFSFKTKFSYSSVTPYAVWVGSLGLDFEDARLVEKAIDVGGQSLVFTISGIYKIDPSLVDNSTSLIPVGTPQQRGQFYASGYHYFFYTNGTNFGFRSATDGVNWGSFVDCPTLGLTNYANRFDVAYCNTTNKVAYIIANVTAGTDWRKLFYRQGSPDGSGGITWDTGEQNAYNVTTDLRFVFYPSISYDVAGYNFVSFYHSRGIVIDIYLIGNNVKNGSWIDRFSVVTVISSTISSNVRPQTIGLAENTTYVAYYYSRYNSSIQGRMWNGSLSANELVCNADVQGVDDWSIAKQGNDLGIGYQASINNTYFPYFKLRNYTTSGWGSKETIYDVAIPANTAVIISANDTCWFASWCKEAPRSIYYEIRNTSQLWTPEGSSYYSINDAYGTPSSTFPDGLSMQSFFWCYGNYLGFGYTYNVGGVFCVRYTFLDFNVVSKAWHDLATWIAILQTRQWVSLATWTELLITRRWNTITTFTESLITRQWNDVSTWSQDFIVRMWHEMATWQQDPITRLWHETTWLADLITLGWHEIALWTITLTLDEVGSIIPILFLSCVLFSIFGAFIYLKKKRG